MRGTAARENVRNPFPCLWNGWRDCAEIWYVVRDPLAKCFTEVDCGIHARALTFPYLGNANSWTDCAETWCVVGGPLDMRCTQNGEYLHEQHVTVHTFKDIYSLPLVHHPKGILLVFIFWWEVWPSLLYYRPRTALLVSKHTVSVLMHFYCEISACVNNLVTMDT